MRITITPKRLLVLGVLLAILVTVLVAGGDPKPATAAPVHNTAFASGASPQMRTNATASIPAANMPACGIQVGSLANVGGWAVRDFVSNGSFATGTLPLQSAPIRPLGTRIGEPCFDTNGHLSLDARFSEIPVPMLDTNGDGKDDGAPPPFESNAGCQSSTTADLASQIVGSCSTRTLYTNSSAANGGFVDITTTYGVFDSSGFTRTGTATLTPTLTSTVSPNSRYIGLTAHCVNLTTGARTAGTPVTQTYTWAAPNGVRPDVSVTASCAVGTRLLGFVMQTYSGPPGGTMTYWKIGTPGYVAPGGYDLGERYYGGTQGAKIAIPGEAPAGQTASYVKCSTAYTGGAETVKPLAYVAGNGVYPTEDAPPVVVDGVATDWSSIEHVGLTNFPQVTATNCPFVTEVGMWVRTYQGTTEAEYGSVWTVWSADRWRTNQPYSGGSEQELICTVDPNATGCYEYNNPPYIDGTDFGVVCADPPAFEWGDFNWLNDFVGHFSRCLFTPVNGFDKNGQIAAAWANSAGGQIGSLVTAGYSAMSITGTCGNLTPGAVIKGAPVPFDTCSWVWASPMRTFLYWAVLILGFGAVFSFATSATISLPSKSATPEPTK